MSLFLYLDGKFCYEENAHISLNDRGYQFGDAVYEVIMYKNGYFLDMIGHIKRLRKSLLRIDFNLEISDNAIEVIMHRLMKENKITYGSVYIQVSRGSYARDHSYINMKLKPVLLIIPKKIKDRFSSKKELKFVQQKILGGLIQILKLPNCYQTSWQNQWQ